MKKLLTVMFIGFLVIAGFIWNGRLTTPQLNSQGLLLVQAIETYEGQKNKLYRQAITETQNKYGYTDKVFDYYFISRLARKYGPRDYSAQSAWAKNVYYKFTQYKYMEAKG